MGSISIPTITPQAGYTNSICRMGSRRVTSIVPAEVGRAGSSKRMRETAARDPLPNLINRLNWQK